MKITENIELCFEDRMSFLSKFPDNYFDYAMPDPEYGIKESSKNHDSRNTPVFQKNGNSLKIKSSGYKKSDWDNSAPRIEFFKELERVSKHQIIFGANYFEHLIGSVQKPPRRNDYNKFLAENPKGWIIWDKLNGNSDFSDCEVIYTSMDFPSFTFYYMWNGMMQGVYCGRDINKAMIQQGNKKLNEKRIHPTQKPVPVYKFLFKELVESGSKIIDTGFGSASIALAAHDFGHTLIGCENNSDNYSKAIERIISHVSIGSLFEPELLIATK